MVATNGDFQNRSRVGIAHQYTLILFWERFSCLYHSIALSFPR